MKLDEELRSLQLDKPIAGKSIQQLQRHTLDEQYNNKPIERSLYILTKGDDLQKLSVIQALPHLLQTDNNATISRIIPKIQQELPTSSSEFHIVTSKVFKLLIEKNVPINLLRPVLQGIESKDAIVSNAWIDTLLAVIPNLPETSVKNDVLPSAVKMSQLNRAVYCRVSSCKILGQISIHSKISAADVKKDILPMVQTLCQDCMYEVRAAMCADLAKVAKGLSGDNLIKTILLPGLVELSNDENVSVRSASVDAIVLMIPYLTSDLIKHTVVQLVKQLCTQSNRPGDLTFPVIAKAYGLLLNNLSNHLTHAEQVWFLEFFKQLSKRGLIISPSEIDMDPSLGVTCRESCAYNLPAITLFTVSKISTELNTWYSVLKDLAGDPCYIVRKTVAACIHEITRILGNENKYVASDLIKLLRDDAEEVLDSLVPNIGVTLELLANSGVLSKDSATHSSLEISRALLKCQVELFKYHNWRRKLAFLQQLEHLPNCMPSDFIHQHFTSVVLKLTIDGRARPVRSQAVRTMLVFLRYNLKENHRKWIRENLINLLCNSQCCYTRHIFIHMCIHAMSVFSGKYFKENFFIPLLKLTEDPVSTVRLCVVNLGPSLKNMLILPIDRTLQIKLENALAKMETMETDKEVIETLKRKLKEMRAPQINRQAFLMEEKKKVEEEERIQQGKVSQSPTRPAGTDTAFTSQASSSRPVGTVTVARPAMMPRRPAIAAAAMAARGPNIKK
ncbi:hypothetical protein NQ317_011710 [Molorchus minor]|uniref:Serine/threonine-protein phosphatase 4 regulatory subunit 4 n=1 Tax=Molorchus minor TaxID=1323400 RepID=A0ABQ9JSS7_9CUCU|nr:hypothetical protein NQ317_011710 [Molorchus minor]